MRPLRSRRLALSGALLAAALLAACGDGGDGAPAGGDPNDTDPGYPDWYTPSDFGGGVPDPSKGAPDCAFDAAQQGTGVGAHIANFALMDADDRSHWLHSDCGGGSKAIWIILAAAW